MAGSEITNLLKQKILKILTFLFVIRLGLYIPVPGVDLDIFLQTLGLQNKIIITTFSSPYTLNSLLTLENFEAIVLGYQSNKYAQKYAAQSIFGGIEIN